jgi:hypothetical protein
MHQKIKPTIHYSYIFSKQIHTNQIDSIFNDVKKNNLDFINYFLVKDENTFDELMVRANQEKKIVLDTLSIQRLMSKVLKSGFKSIEHICLSK